MMKRRGHACLIASSMATFILLMMVLFGTIGSQQPGASSFRRDYQLLGRPLYKLDLSWPRNPELFTGDVFGVAVNQYAGVVYVAQRGKLTWTLDLLDLWSASGLGGLNLRKRFLCKKLPL